MWGKMKKAAAGPEVSRDPAPEPTNEGTNRSTRPVQCWGLPGNPLATFPTKTRLSDGEGGSESEGLTTVMNEDNYYTAQVPSSICVVAAAHARP